VLVSVHLTTLDNLFRWPAAVRREKGGQPRPGAVYTILSQRTAWLAWSAIGRNQRWYHRGTRAGGYDASVAQAAPARAASTHTGPFFFFCDAYGLSDVNEETARELSAVTSRRQPSPSVRESASAQGRRDATVSPLGAFQLTTSAVVPTTSCQGDVRSAR